MSAIPAQNDPPLILVVDDDKATLLLLRRVMEHEGYRVVEAEDGPEALDLYGSRQPDIVLLDAMLPSMDGFTTCARLQALYGPKAAPVLMITSLGDGASVDRAFAAGASDYLTKPIHWAVLRQRVRRLLQARRDEIALQAAKDDLELRVAERTAELQAANERLQRELAERERVEAALRESEERFRVLFEHSPDAVLLLDPHHPDVLWPIVVCNDAASRMNGYTREELVGQSIELLSTGQPTREGCAAFLEQLRREGTIHSETVHRRKDGTYFPIEFSISLISLGGKELVLGIDRDITERRRAEEALRQSAVLQESIRARSEFIANIAHELGSPLHHIQGYARTLLTPGMAFDQETTRDFLAIIADESDKIQRLITDLLDASRLEADTFTLDIESAQIDEVILRVVRRWRGESSHRFRVSLPADVPPVPADTGRIEQVLENLLANVVRHTAGDTPAEIDLQVTRDELIVTVQDHGTGIPAEHLPHVFDPLYQAKQPASGRRRGNGLGLFICKGIVEQHGGRIWAEPTVGSGVTFRFALPRRFKASGSRQAHELVAMHAA